jgi:hypothetical protein
MITRLLNVEDLAKQRCALVLRTWVFACLLDLERQISNATDSQLVHGSDLIENFPSTQSS